MAEEVKEVVAEEKTETKVVTDKKKFFKHNKNKKKVCAFCEDKNLKSIDYKDANRLKKYVTEKGKIISSRQTGTCSRHQRVQGQICLLPQVFLDFLLLHSSPL